MLEKINFFVVFFNIIWAIKVEAFGRELWCNFRLFSVESSYKYQIYYYGKNSKLTYRNKVK